MANKPSSADDLFCIQQLLGRLLQEGRRQHSQKRPEVQASLNIIICAIYGWKLVYSWRPLLCRVQAAKGPA